jgi:hypothetical protein
VQKAWIRRAGPIFWPPRSPDFESYGCYLLRYVKTQLYQPPIPHRFPERISKAEANIDESQLAHAWECNILLTIAELTNEAQLNFMSFHDVLKLLHICNRLDSTPMSSSPRSFTITLYDMPLSLMHVSCNIASQVQAPSRLIWIQSPSSLFPFLCLLLSFKSKKSIKPQSNIPSVWIDRSNLKRLAGNEKRNGWNGGSHSTSIGGLSHYWLYV